MQAAKKFRVGSSEFGVRRRKVPTLEENDLEVFLEVKSLGDRLVSSIVEPENMGV